LSDDLLVLAARYVALNQELGEVRARMKVAVLNGGGSEERPFATPRAPRRTRKRPAPSEEASQETNEAENAILAALKEKPMRHGEVTRATGQKASTVQVRLARLQKRGLIARGDDLAWAVSSP
jgi:predicted Rossmann fold nucleotide-binding protein DprA/Smf involved in DNA uptake